jgi:hypothetical protein
LIALAGKSRHPDATPNATIDNRITSKHRILARIPRRVHIGNVIANRVETDLLRIQGASTNLEC